MKQPEPTSLPPSRIHRCRGTHRAVAIEPRVGAKVLVEPSDAVQRRLERSHSRHEENSV